MVQCVSFEFMPWKNIGFFFQEAARTSVWVGAFEFSQDIPCDNVQPNWENMWKMSIAIFLFNILLQQQYSSAVREKERENKMNEVKVAQYD